MRRIILPLLLVFFLGGILMNCENQDNLQNRTFIEFQKKMETIKNDIDRQAEADKFIQNVKKTEYPIFEDDTTVVLLFQGKNEKIGIIGDMSQWTEIFPMEKVRGTNLFYKRLNLESDARMEYCFSESIGGWLLTDSLTPNLVLNGLWPSSELAMPKYERHPYFDEYLNGKKGDFSLVKEYEIPAGILPYPHKIFVYTPPEYNKAVKYPVVCFQDGMCYIEFAMMPLVIDKLIKAGEIEPIIAVFVTPPNRHKSGSPNRSTEYGLNEDYVKFFADEMIPFIGEKYSISDNPKSRMVLGDSYGGLISVAIPFLRPDVFGIGYGQSGYHSLMKDKLIKMILKSEKKDIRLWVDVGTYERSVGASFLPKDETDFLMANRRMRDVLKQKGYDFVYHEYHEGHTWGNWRRHAIDALKYYFGKNVQHESE